MGTNPTYATQLNNYVLIAKACCIHNSYHQFSTLTCNNTQNNYSLSAQTNRCHCMQYAPLATLDNEISTRGTPKHVNVKSKRNSGWFGTALSVRLLRLGSQWLDSTSLRNNLPQWLQLHTIRAPYWTRFQGGVDLCSLYICGINPFLRCHTTAKCPTI